MTGGNLRWLQGPGQREDVNLLRPGFPQNLRALLDRRPGGENIVNEQEMLLGDRLHSADLECAADILLPFRPRELSLGFGVAGALEGSEIQGNGMHPADTAGQEERLIESPLTEAPGMKRNAEDPLEIGEGEVGIFIFSQESAQRLGQPGFPPVFEAVNRLGHQPFIRTNGSGPREMALLGETVGAEMVFSGGISEAQTAAGAAGMGKEFYSCGTEGTSMIVGHSVEAIAAEETLGGKEEIDQRAPEGSHLWYGSPRRMVKAR